MNALIGTWKLVSKVEEGMAIFTETHYSMISTAKTFEPFAHPDEPSTEEAAAVYNTKNQNKTWRF